MVYYPQPDVCQWIWVGRRRRRSCSHTVSNDHHFQSASSPWRTCRPSVIICFTRSFSTNCFHSIHYEHESWTIILSWWEKYVNLGQFVGDPSQLPRTRMLVVIVPQLYITSWTSETSIPIWTSKNAAVWCLLSMWSSWVLPSVEKASHSASARSVAIWRICWRDRMGWVEETDTSGTTKCTNMRVCLLSYWT